MLYYREYYGYDTSVSIATYGSSRPYTNDDTVERTKGKSSKLYGTTIKYARMSRGLSIRWDLDERCEVATLELYEICFI